MPDARPRVAVLPAGEADLQRARALALRYRVPLLPCGESAAGCDDRADIVLLVSADGLALQQAGPGAPGPVRADFGDPSMRHRRRGGHNELLGRAVGVGRLPELRVIDATAGLGRDSCVLADLGCQVTACERHPLVACLLGEALSTAQSGTDDWLAALARRITLHAGDVRTLPARAIADTDVIYLDPMFPPRDKRAAVKKDMALFQRLLADQADPSEAADLFDWALGQPVPRVVVKRPRRAPPLGLRKPSHHLAGRAVRFDVYALAVPAVGQEGSH